MSKHHYETITCPECGKESQFLVWESINTVIDPDMKTKVRSGEAFRWHCPSCDAESDVEYACLYHQMEDHVMIYFVPGDATKAVEFMQMEGDPMFSVMKEYTKRVVTTRNQFREKLLIIDASLDDRIIELMKPFMVSMLHDSSPDIHVQEIRYAVQADGTPCFAVRIGEHDWGHADFHQDLYDKVKQIFLDKLKDNKNIVIDFEWAMSMIREDN